MSFKTGKIMVAFIVLLLSSAYGDDGVVDISGGTAKLLDGITSVSLVKQYVLIDTLKYPEYYKVTAWFTFLNQGESITLAVGFPAQGNSKRNRKFKQFITWVNGRPTPTKDYPVREFDSGRSYEFFKVKKVYFPANQITNTKVEYQAPFGQVAAGPAFACYLYGTGGSWKGKIKQAVFEVRFSEKHWIKSNSNQEDYSVPVRDRGKEQMVYCLTGLEPKASAVFTFYIQEFNKIMVLMSHEYAHIRPWDTWSKGSKIFKSEFKIENLKALSLLQLKVLSSEIDARHGSTFQDRGIQEYFNLMNWYRPDPDFSKEKLTDLDRRNITKIKQVQGKISNSTLSQQDRH